MAITKNRTYPQEWNESRIYEYGDTVIWNNVIYKCVEEPCQGDNPALDSTHWCAIDINKKDATLMDHGYSGDEKMWERDVFWVDQTTGDVYINGENTGINVKGPAGIVKWDNLTPEQRELLKGDRGPRGEKGEQGEKGDKGDTGAVVWDNLTPEQIAQLRGDGGASAYDVWRTIPGHEDGTLQDFITDITGPPTPIDDHLDGGSLNPVQNRAIVNYLQRYEDLISRVSALENRLQYKWNDKTYKFTFGVTQEGEFGYLDPDTQEVVPFNKQRQPIIYSNLVENADQILFANMATDHGNVELMDRLTLSNDKDGETTNLNTDNVLYATGVQMESLADAFDAKYYLYRNGVFERYKASCNYYRVGLDDVGRLISQGVQFYEGSWSGIDTGRYASNITFVVEPFTIGATINCVYGAHQAATANLPEIILGTDRVSITSGSFDSETSFTIPIQEGQGGYFASVNSSPNQYIIKEIYLS